MKFDKTVLQIIPTLNEGGAERTTIEITSAIVNSGGRALVATEGGRLSGEITAAGGQIIKVPVATKNPVGIWSNIKRIRTIIENEKIDLVHARSRAPAWSAKFAVAGTPTAFVTTYHGAYRAGSAFKRYLNSSMVRSELIIANSEFTAASIRQNYPEAAPRIKVIPRGADLADFDPARVSQERVNQVAESWGLSPNWRGVLFILPARFSTWKGHEIVIEALELLKSIVSLKNGGEAGAPSGQAQNLKVLFVGDLGSAVPYVARLKNMIEERGVRSMTAFVGHCADMPAAYLLADCVLAPSTRPEAFGRTVVEAGAMGRVAIAADHGGAKETVIEGVTGFLASPSESEALADSMIRTMELGEDGRNAMGLKAREHVASTFSVAAMQERTLEAYNEALSLHSRVWNA